MKFILDVNVGGSLCSWLAKKGYDVRQVRERDSRMTDEQVLEWAVEEERIIVTCDKDFGELIVVQGYQHYGVVRLPDVPIERRKILLTQILQRFQVASMQNTIITVSGNRIRIRKTG